MFVLSRTRTAWLLAIALAMGSLAPLLSAQPVLANGYPPVDFYVTPTSGGEGDEACELDPETNCSLQEALNVSGANGLHHDNIYLAAGSYTDGPYTYLGESSDPEVFLTGDSRETTFIENISGGPAMYFATPGLVLIDEITFRNNTDGGVFVEDVSGESAGFDVNIQDSSFIDNGDTGVRVSQDTHSGRAQILNSTFSGNAGQRAGGAISILGTNGETSLSVALYNVTATNNSAMFGEGEADGGGAYIYTQGPDSPVVVTRSTFTDNVAQRMGGGLFVVTSGTDSYVTIGGLEGDGNTFTGNSALYDNGGGFSATTNDLDAPITVQGNTLKGNSSHWGGGFFLDTNGFGGDTSLTVTNNIVGGTEPGEGNTSEIDGGGMYLWIGGGATVENNTVIGNTGGMAYVGGGGIGAYVDREEVNEGTVSFSYNIVEQNTAPYGAGVGIRTECNCSTTVDGNRISQNVGEESGGGITLLLNATGGVTRVRSNIIDGNILSGMARGAGMNISTNASYGVDVVNNTIVGNRLTASDDVQAWGGAGIYFTGSGGEGLNDYTFANNIFWENTSNLPVSDGGEDMLIGAADWGAFTFAYNDIIDICRVAGDGEPSLCNNEEHVTTLGFTSTPGNIYNKNPWFEDQDAGDYRPTAISATTAAGSSDISNVPSGDFGGYEMNEPPDMGAFQLRTIGYPEVVTGDAIDVNRSNATTEGTIANLGDGDLIRAGILVGSTANDYTLSFSSSEDVTEGVAFKTLSTSLACNTTYHYVAYGKTNAGTSYGEDDQFTTESCRSGGGGSNGYGGSYIPPTSSLTSYPSYTPTYNPATGHLEAPGSKQAGPSPFTGETEWISLVSPGWYIRGEHYDTVYYVDQNLHRHPLWDAQTYFTWNESFDSIIWVTDATLQTLTMDTPILYKPGVVLVKISDQPFVYAIGTDGLRQIPDETTALAVYGTDWADYVLDIPPILFPNFGKGTQVSTDEHADKTKMKKRTTIAAML